MTSINSSTLYSRKTLTNKVISFVDFYVRCASFLKKHITSEIVFYDLFKPNLIDVKSNIDHLYYVFTLFQIDFQKVKKTIMPSLSATQRKTGEINFKIFQNTLKYFKVDTKKYINFSNKRDKTENRLLTFYELLDVWKEVKKFYTNK